MNIELTSNMKDQWERDGYFVVRNVISPDQAREIRGVLVDKILSYAKTPEGHEFDPAGVEGDSPEARISRARKLGNFGWESPLIWHTIHAGWPVTSLVRQFLGDDLLVKYAACFLKPPRVGSSTPWHQDNALWRDGELDNFNLWMAIDAATRENGCMQMIPGTHTWPIIEHQSYPDGVHAEIPREHMEEVLAKHDVIHAELDPGDMICWRSSLYHFSPPNHSDQSRIAVAAVYNSLAMARANPRPYRWAMREGRLVESWPPVVFDEENELQASSAASAPAY